MAFSYKDYAESDKVKKYATDLAAYEQTKPVDWNGGTYGQQVNDALKKVLNREKFTYDLAGDALYDQYKDQYMGLGKLAMKDTMGQASALTGGYGNSYASTAGNQAYQGYLSQLNAVVPELYSMAREAYDKEGDTLANQYALLKGQNDDEYAKYRDSLNDWNAQRDYLANQYNNERGIEYDRYNADRNLAYQIARDAVADEQWQKQYDLSVANANRSSGGVKVIDGPIEDEPVAPSKKIIDKIQSGLIPEYEYRLLKTGKSYQEYLEQELRFYTQKYELTNGEMLYMKKVLGIPDNTDVSAQ